jgi:hypothetical protein
VYNFSILTHLLSPLLYTPVVALVVVPAVVTGFAQQLHDVMTGE